MQTSGDFFKGFSKAPRVFWVRTSGDFKGFSKAPKVLGCELLVILKDFLRRQGFFLVRTSGDF